jgi:hypothetical protein
MEKIKSKQKPQTPSKELPAAELVLPGKTRSMPGRSVLWVF